MCAVVSEGSAARSVDDLLTASSSLETQPLLQPTTVGASAVQQVPVLTVEDTHNDTEEAEPQVEEEEEAEHGNPWSKSDSSVGEDQT